MAIKTFRGLLTDGAQDTIVLHTNDGSTGYRIVKFQIMPKLPGSVAAEHVVQIWKIAQSSVPTSDPPVDFSDQKKGAPSSDAPVGIVIV